jgi:hypothetical protein
MTRGQIDMDGRELDAAEAAAERRRIRLHGKPWDHGIHWPGPCAAGTEIERASYIEDDPLDDHSPIYEGDLEAALVVADNGSPWLTFEDWGPDSPAPRWVITAYPDEDRARLSLADHLRMASQAKTAYMGIVFDGRTQTLIPHPTEPTYLRTTSARPIKLGDCIPPIETGQLGVVKVWPGGVVTKIEGEIVFVNGTSFDRALVEAARARPR